jgi:regulator of protease activity HflC (stomatin/prohibitin superfamily)
MPERDRDRDPRERDIPLRDRDVRERDIPVAPNEYAYVQDLTKGDVNLYVGPCKISLTNTERMVEFHQGRFRPLRGEDGGSGVYPFILAASSQYIIAENPPRDPNARYSKGNNSAIELVTGKKIVVAGPAAFALWPGQKAQVIDGHALREDQYLLVRVYDAVEGEQGEKSPIGTERIIKGTEVNFYIPRTGLEVVPEKGQYVRNAVTLLDGEYCILLAPNGQRKYVRGPAVVFPEPMEQFVTAGGAQVFRAHTLKKNAGLHVRVLKDVTIADRASAATAGAPDQVPPGSYAAGQEIFLKDKEGFFFPTEHFEVVASVPAIPIAEKEGVYVRDIDTGLITTEVGPKYYLPDPTRVEVVPRPLDKETARLYGLTNHDPAKAISIYIPPSAAVLVIAKNKREVVLGPLTRILDFDEDLEVLRLSMGKPKTDEKLLSTCFLQIDGNKVSDILRVRTNDHVDIQLLLSYRVSFLETETSRWFNVKNYVALLCDHLASIVRSAVRATPIDAFHANSIEIIRGAILGSKQGEEKRAGRRFAENGMAVYDVEVLDLNILDADVRKLLADAQRAAIVAEVKKEEEELRLNGEKLREAVNQQLSEARKTTLQKEAELEGAVRAVAEAKATAEVHVHRLRKTGMAQNEADALGIAEAARHAAAVKELELTTSELQHRVAAFKEQMSALQPDLVATLRVLGNQSLTTELTRNLSPLAILGGESIADVTERLLRALPIGLNADGIKSVLAAGTANDHS